MPRKIVSLFWLVVLIGFLVTGFVCITNTFGASQKGVATKARSQHVRAATKSKKVESFLSQIKKAGSLDQVSSAFMNTNFSSAELEQIKKELRSPVYKQKIKQLITSSERQEIVIKKTYKRSKPTRKDNKKVIRAKLAQAKAAARQRKARRAPGVRLIPKTEIAKIKAYIPSSSGPKAEITSISPRSGAAGASVTIRGEKFGPMGRVAILIGDNLLYADVSSWSATRIVATLPEAVQSVVGEEEKNGIIWVKLAGGENGPYIDFNFMPNPSMLVPVISEVNPDPIYPSSDILITGSNFLTKSEPIVRARSGSVEVTLRVIEWSDCYIFVRSGTDHGSTLTRIPSGGFFLSVENHVGASARKAVTMARRLVRRTVTFSPHEIHCEAWNTSRDRPSVFCWVGYKNTFNVTRHGCPDWNVVGYTVVIHRQGCCSGYSFKREPFGNSAGYEIELWANAFGYIELHVEVEMEGPEGTFCTRR